MPFDPATIAAIGIPILTSILSKVAANKTAHRGKMKQTPLGTQQQRDLANFVGQRGQQLLNNPSEGFEPIRQQAVRNFHESVYPSLAERFTAQTNAAASSPSFASQVGAAGAAHGNQLAALEAQYRQNQQQQGLNFLNVGLRPQFENNYQPGSPSTLSSFLAA